MKSLLRTIVVNSVALFAITQLLEGVKIDGGFTTFLFSGLVLSILSIIIKPILKIIALPINIITLGGSAFILNVAISAIVLYFLTIFVPQITITSFTFKGMNLAGFVIPKFFVGNFLAFIISALLISLIVKISEWFVKD